MENHNRSKIETLIQKGVRIVNPDCVEIGDDVDLNRISGNGVVIHSGCRIVGSSTLILHGARLGYEGPVTLENCQVGPEVVLNGGFFKQAVFLKQAGSGSGVRARYNKHGFHANLRPYLRQRRASATRARRYSQAR